MKITLSTLIASCVISLVTYTLLGAFVIDKPISLGSIEPMFRKKLDYAYTQPSPKLIIIAGSNARTSHRCAELEQMLDLPCVNGGNTAGLGLSYVFQRFDPIIKSGDVVYLPLEYQQYLVTEAEVLSSPDASILLRHDKLALLHRGPNAVVHAIFMLDLSYVIDGLTEMILHTAGLKARFDSKAFDAEGDEVGLTHEKGRRFAEFIAHSRWKPPTADDFDKAHGAKEIISAFISACKTKGARVIGGLPVSFDDVPLPEELIESIRHFYESNGADFLILQSRSRYPRDHFYDSPFHLDEEMTVQHTRILAEALRPMLRKEILLAHPLDRGNVR